MRFDSVNQLHAECYSLSLQSGQFSEDMIPTVGFNMRKVTKGNVTIKVCHPWGLSLFKPVRGCLQLLV